MKPLPCFLFLLLTVACVQELPAEPPPRERAAEAAPPPRLLVVLECDAGHPALGEGFSVNEFALRTVFVRHVASAQLKLLNPGRTDGQNTFTRQSLFEFIEKLDVRAGDALILYLACERSVVDEQEFFRLSGDKDARFSRQELLEALRARKARLTGLITDAGSAYVKVQGQTRAISAVYPAVETTSPLFAKLFFESPGILNVASARATEQARFHDNYTPRTDLAAGQFDIMLVAGQVAGPQVGPDHDLRFGYYKCAGKPLRGGFFTEALTKTLGDKPEQPLAWPALLEAVSGEMQAQLKSQPGEQHPAQTLQVFQAGGGAEESPPKAADENRLGVRVTGEQAGGVLVTEVQPGSLAAAYGLVKGDVLLTVNGQPVKTPQELLTATRGEKPWFRLTGKSADGKAFAFLVKTAPAPARPSPPSLPEPADAKSDNADLLPPRDPVEAGRQAATLLLPLLLKEPADPQPRRVAILPFVNREGRLLVETLDAATAIAGELGRELRNAEPATLTILPPEPLRQLPPELLRQFREPGPLDEAAFLKALDCDFLIAGRFDTTSAAESLTARRAELGIHVSLFSRTGLVKTLRLVAETRCIQPLPGDKPDVVALELISGETVLPLRQEDRPGLGTVLVAEIPPALVNQPYTIRLTSQGKPFGYRNRNPEQEQARLTAVALFVEGVGSLAQPAGPEGELQFGWGHWSRTPKHTLTSPGFAVVHVETGLQVKPVAGEQKSGSVLEVSGFASPLDSRPLTFSRPLLDESPLTLYFLAEKLPGDRRIPRPGEALIPSHYEPVRVVPWYEAPLLHAPPILTYRVVYRVKEE